MADLKSLKGVSAQDRKLIEDAEILLGPEPGSMGFVKNLFWGRLREELVFPYPQQSPDENTQCEALLAKLDHYLRTEHPAVQIDQEQEIPKWVIQKLFDLGILGMTIPKEFGGLGLGITSYNRVLQRIGRYCGSTAVLVSAHQSIGCKAIMLFGTPEQKQNWLPKLASSWLSAFCLSEPNVGCDAGGQETTCRLSDDGQYYILNGEKKWATSGALSGLFTVMAKQKIKDPKSAKEIERVSALVCTPDMPGVDIFQKNRSKMTIRGTWQARIRFHDVHVPKANLLHQEGKGLTVALSCLNYGRCTLSAGMLGGAQKAFEQSTKWVQTRYQFQRPLAEFELVQLRVARMAALTYAMDAVLYMTTAMLDRHDEDIMMETAMCKVFNSWMGYEVVNDAVQIMGGEAFMTENEIERIFRDSRINPVVEGANEVMQSFIFAYGGKQLAEKMLGVQQAVGWNKDESTGDNFKRIFKNLRNSKVFKAAMPLGLELFLRIKPRAPKITRVDSSLRSQARTLSKLIRDHSHVFKLASKKYEDAIVSRQAVQARIADSAMWIHAYACTLSKLEKDLKSLRDGVEKERNRTAAMHFFDLAEQGVTRAHAELWQNTDDTMLPAAKAAFAFSDMLPNANYVIHEASPNAKGTGHRPASDSIKQFPGGNVAKDANGQSSVAPQREPVGRI